MKPNRVVSGRRTNINMTNQLRQLRMDAEITQADIAERINVPRGTYSTFECGACLPTADVLDSLVSVLKCKPESIYASVYLDIIKMESF